MFTLRQQHQSAFQTKAEADFVQEVMQYLQKEFPNSLLIIGKKQLRVKYISEKILRDFCKIAILISRKKGVKGSNETRAFISYMIILGLNFYEHNLLSKYFLPLGSNANEFIFRIPHLSENDWKEIKEFCKN